MVFEGTRGENWILWLPALGPHTDKWDRSASGRRRNATQHDSTLLLGTGGDFEFSADVERNLSGVIIDEVADAVVRDAAEFGPLAQGADGGLATGGENPAGAKTDDVGELGVDLRVEAGSGNGGWVHALKAGCQRRQGAQKKPAPVRVRAVAGVARCDRRFRSV